MAQSPKDRFLKYAERNLQTTMETYGPIYKQKEFDSEVNEYLTRIIKLIVKKNIFYNIDSDKK